MPTYKALRAIAYNGRHAAGEIVEMREVDAEAFGPDYVEPVEATEEAPEEPETTEGEPQTTSREQELNLHTVEELKAIADEKGVTLKARAKKEDIIAAIVEAENAPQEPSEEPEEPETTEDGESDESTEEAPEEPEEESDDESKTEE